MFLRPSRLRSPCPTLSQLRFCFSFSGSSFELNLLSFSLFLSDLSIHPRLPCLITPQKKKKPKKIFSFLLPSHFRSFFDHAVRDHVFTLLKMFKLSAEELYSVIYYNTFFFFSYKRMLSKRMLQFQIYSFQKKIPSLTALFFFILETLLHSTLPQRSQTYF